MSKDVVNSRTQILAAVFLGSLILFLSIHYWIKPRIDNLSELSDERTELQKSYEVFSHNLTIRPELEKRFKDLQNATPDANTDEVVLVSFLKDLENFSKYPTLTLVNMKPMEAKTESGNRIFRVRMSIAGKLPDLLQYVGDLSKSPRIIGIEGYSIRATQGDNIVECTVTFWMIKVLS